MLSFRNLHSAVKFLHQHYQIVKQSDNYNKKKLKSNTSAAAEWHRNIFLNFCGITIIIMKGYNSVPTPPSRYVELFFHQDPLPIINAPQLLHFEQKILLLQIPG